MDENCASEGKETPAHRRRSGVHRRWRRLGLPAVLALLTALAAWSGCAAFQSSADGEGPRSSVLNPQWDEDALDEHLRFFRSALNEKPVQPAGVAAYVADRMKEAWLQPAVEGRYRLPETPAEAPRGFIGYVAGKNPEYSREVVIVCADLTAGAPATSAAALLEVARAYGTFAQYEPVPERSVLFALWFQPDSLHAAEQDGPADGLRAYLHRPTWSLEAVRSVLYMGLPPARRAAVEALLDAYDLPLRRIAAPSVAAPPRAEAAGEAASDPEATVDEAAIRQAEIRRALALAQRTHERLRAETITSGEMMPALGDTLRVPREQE